MTETDFQNKKGTGKYSAAEWQARVDLAAMYRLAAKFHYDDLIWNHITMRVPGTDHQFLLNRFGLMYTEVTASNLIKVDEHGSVIDGPEDVNTAGFIIHSAIHNDHHDMKVVFHAHVPAALAVTALKDGVQMLVQDSAMLHGEIGYHEWEGLSLSTEERGRLSENMRGKKALIMRNHGFMTVGATAGEAFVNMYYLDRACKVMLQAHATGRELDAATPAMWDLARKQYDHFPPGKYEWPALLRMLDRDDPSYRY
ncbi:MAG: class II aldolase/adducin family protein [Alphaproteobacteria bacterium]|nr:class II aldolase/adducin family protein [Alphaproteobacteria bacterium]